MSKKRKHTILGYDLIADAIHNLLDEDFQRGDQNKGSTNWYSKTDRNRTTVLLKLQPARGCQMAEFGVNAAHFGSKLSKLDWPRSFTVGPVDFLGFLVFNDMSVRRAERALVAIGVISPSCEARSPDMLREQKFDSQLDELSKGEW